MNIDTILKAINLVQYESIKEVSVSVEDLVLLREAIISQKAQLIQSAKENKRLRDKIELSKLSKPMRLDSYA